jgi:hypothetical protein
MNENDMLDIPSLETVQFYSRPNKNASEIVTKGSSISQSKKTKQKELNKKRSPNEQIVGDKNYVLDKSLGLIFY